VGRALAKDGAPWSLNLYNNQTRSMLDTPGAPEISVLDSLKESKSILEYFGSGIATQLCVRRSGLQSSHGGAMPLNLRVRDHLAHVFVGMRKQA